MPSKRGIGRGFPLAGTNRFIISDRSSSRHQCNMHIWFGGQELPHGMGVLAQDRDFAFLSKVVRRRIICVTCWNIGTCEIGDDLPAAACGFRRKFCCVSRLELLRAVQDLVLALLERRCKKTHAFDKLRSKYADTTTTRDGSSIFSQSTGFGRRGPRPSQHHSGPDGLATVLVRRVRSGRGGNQRLRCGMRPLIGQCLAQVRAVRLLLNTPSFGQAALLHRRAAFALYEQGFLHNQIPVA